MFFSFEGIDGSGKSTHARLLAEALRERGYEVIDVREPGGTPLGEQIRSLLLNPASQIAPRAELLLFSAARAQLVDDVIVPALARGAVVLADRFFDSATAYQGGGRQLADAAQIEALHDFATAGVRPDRTYYFDLDISIATQRRGDRDADRMEQGGDGYYQRIVDAYRRLAADEPSRILRLNADQPIEPLHSAVRSDALRVLDRE